MSGFTLDAGALIAIERNDRPATHRVYQAIKEGREVVVPAGALAQVWRDGARQVRLTRLVASPRVRIEPLDGVGARAAGQLCGSTGTADIVDASVVLCAQRRGHTIITSDPGDLRRLDPTVALVEV